MNKFFLLFFVLMLTVASVNLSQAANENPGENNILTAIDVVELITSGSGGSDVVRILSDQRGYDRRSDLNKGLTDTQIIQNLITQSDNNIGLNDNMAIQHENQGDRHFKEMRYDKAAKEYTSAIRYSQDNFDLYKSRGDVYRQYLKTKWASTFNNYTGSRKLFASKATQLICTAAYSDYDKALRLVKQNMIEGKGKIENLKGKMSQKEMSYDANVDVVPYYNKPAQKTLDMRKMGKYRQSQRDSTLATIEIKKALAECKLICGPNIEANNPVK